MKKYLKPKVLMVSFASAVAILLLASISLRFYVKPGVPYTHDGENHLARFANYKLAVKEGQFPPRFAPNLANRYGYPVFNYNYPLANIASLPFSLIKLPYTVTFKLLMTVSVVGGLVGILLWLKQWQVSRWAIWLGVAVFATHPYLVAAILYRGNIGEVVAMGLMPWLLIVIEKIRQRKLTIYSPLWLGVPLLWAAFFLSHNVTVLIGTPVILVYAALRLKKMWRPWLTLITSLGLGIGLSLWFWLPAWVEKSAVVLDKADLSVQYSDHFVTLTQLFFSALTFGYDFVGSIDSLSFQLGWLASAVLILALVVTVKNWWQRWRIPNGSRLNSVMLSATLGVTALLILQLAVSQPLWQIIPILRFAQFPWRFMLLVAVFMPLVAASLYDSVSRSWRLVLWLLVIVQILILGQLKPVDTINKPNLEYDNFSQTTSTLNENLPVTFTYGLNGKWQPSAEFVTGAGEVTVESWNGTERKYRLTVTDLATVVEPTMNFLGWETTVKPEGTVNPFVISYLDNETVAGRIGYQLPSGVYEVRTQFTQHTWSRQLSHVITLISGIILGIWGWRISWKILTVKSKKGTDRGDVIA